MSKKDGGKLLLLLMGAGLLIITVLAFAERLRLQREAEVYGLPPPQFEL
jgi:hypothetical protein